MLRLLQVNSESGLECALAEYGGIVKTIVFRVLFDYPEDAEECIADTFLRLWKNRNKLRGAPVRAWLIVTARNTAIDRFRKLNKTACTELSEDIAADAYLPEQGIGTLIDSMQPPDREIFIRKYYFLETALEIAQKMGRTESDINTRLSRGRKQLKAQLLKEGGYYEHRALQGN